MKFQNIFIVLTAISILFAIFLLYKKNSYNRSQTPKNLSPHDIPIDSLENELRGYAWDAALDVIKSLQSSELANASTQSRQIMFTQAYLKALQEKAKTLSPQEKQAISEKMTPDEVQRIIAALHENKPTHVSIDKEMEALEYGLSVSFLANVKWDTAEQIMNFSQAERNALTLLDLKKIYRNVLQEKLALQSEK